MKVSKTDKKIDRASAFFEWRLKKGVSDEGGVGPEQFLYALILQIGMYAGLAVLFITFAMYVFGVVKPYIPLNEISHYWNMSVHDYLRIVNIEIGWSWLKMLGYGDFVNFIGVALLGGVTIICYLAIVPVLLRNNDEVFAVLAILEVMVLGLAASGILLIGRH